MPASRTGEHQRCGRPPAHSAMGRGVNVAVAMHAKTKQSAIWRKSCHGRVWELEEERQAEAGKGCDEGSSRPLQ